MGRPSWIGLLVACATVVAVQAFVGDAIPVGLGLGAALFAPVAVLALAMPPERRASFPVLALAAVLAPTAALVPYVHARIVAGAFGGPQIAAALLGLLVLAGVAPAVALAWAHARRPPDRRP